MSEERAENGAAGDSGKLEATVTDLRRGEMFFSTLRKPDFQRETAAWDPQMVMEFVKAFVEGELIPSVICWLSGSRLSFVIDGAHRLSAIIAWLTDDYGDGDLTQRMYNGPIPDDQRRVAEKTRALIKRHVGMHKDYLTEVSRPGAFPHLAQNVRTVANAKVPLQWIKGSD